MTYDELKEEIKTAMKARDKDRLRILRQLHGEIKQIEVDERRAITDKDVTDMTKRVLKQTREMLENSIKAANDDERTARLEDQVKVLEGLLPQQLTGPALVELVEKTIAELGATSKRDMGSHGRAGSGHRRQPGQGAGGPGSGQAPGLRRIRLRRAGKRARRPRPASLLRPAPRRGRPGSPARRVRPAICAFPSLTVWPTGIFAAAFTRWQSALIMAAVL